MPKASLEAAYGATTYRILFPEGWLNLRVGKVVPEGMGLFPWMVITACNPASRILSDMENNGRNQALAGRLQALGLPFQPAENVADGAAWPVEPGFWVGGPGLDREVARALGREFGQHAVLWSEGGEAPQLLWCGAESGA